MDEQPIEMVNGFPKYVTDGSHIYLWNEEYEQMLQDGRLRPSGPPVIPKVKPLSARERTRLEALRQQALREAEEAVELFKSTMPAKSIEDIFGAPPQDKK